MTVAVIPARGGSKRIPGKNLRPFLGVPVIERVLAACAASGIFRAIAVSTDDGAIAAAAARCGASVIDRPGELADDHAGLLPVMRHAVDAMGLPDDARACCAYATAALLRAEDLRAGLARLSGHRFVVGVVPSPHPVERSLRLEEGKLAPAFPGHALTRTQDLPEAWFDAGQFIWGTAAAFRDPDPVLERADGLPLDPWRAVDLDTEEHWARAEALAVALGEAAREPR